MGPYDAHYVGVEVSDLYKVTGEAPSPNWTTVPQAQLVLDWGGIPGDRHYGTHREIPAYETAELRKQQVLNERQLSILAREHLRDIAYAMELPIRDIEDATGMDIEDYMARMLAGNIMVSGNPTYHMFEAGSTLLFMGDAPHAKSAVRLSEVNLPCKKPATMIHKDFKDRGISYANGEFQAIKHNFKDAAEDRRGWVGFVYKTGLIAVNDEVVVRQPIR